MTTTTKGNPMTTTHNDLVPEVTIQLSSGEEITLTGRDARTCPNRPFFEERTVSGKLVLCMDTAHRSLDKNVQKVRRRYATATGSLRWIEDAWVDAIESGCAEYVARELICETLLSFGGYVDPSDEVAE
jgi:hypothetical protein